MHAQKKRTLKRSGKLAVAVAVLAAGLMSCKEEPKYNFPPLPKAYEIAEGKSSAGKTAEPAKSASPTASPTSTPKEEKKEK